jgi:2-polyprenyl-3-methyl-5-hydroxy-6-metoxy-1,4-benzoquinol methylase
MKEIYDHYIENAFGERMQSVYKIREFEYNYRKIFPSSKDLSLLDIGVGRGEMLSCMKMWGYSKYLGIDISSSTVEFCKNLGLNCIEIKDTISWLKEYKDQFALITILDVLEHFPKSDIIPLLQAIRAALKKEGILIIQVPNLQAPDSQLHRYNDFTHEVGFIEHSLEQVLLASGFRGYEFHGYETLLFCKMMALRKAIRRIYWSYVKLTRFINGNLNPRILHPVFYAVVRKSL